MEEENAAPREKMWARPFTLNPNAIEYGEKKAEVEDFTLLDAQGTPTNTIEKFTDVTIKMRIRFHQDVDDPIYAFTIKDLRGTELTGTNTMYEKASIHPCKAGDVQEISFTQRMNLQGGEYLLSLGCTGYHGGEFVVYHRLYDICNITVVSTKNTVGFFDMDSKVTVADEIS